MKLTKDTIIEGLVYKVGTEIILESSIKEGYNERDLFSDNFGKALENELKRVLNSSPETSPTDMAEMIADSLYDALSGRWKVVRQELSQALSGVFR